MKRFITVAALVAASFSITLPAQAHVLPRHKQCRRATSAAIVRCFGRAFGGRSLVRTALRVGRCESGLNGWEAPHSDPYHGEYQYLTSTFAGQQSQIRVQVRKYQLSGDVHNTRANDGTAVIWASKHGWSPWSCY